jgi:hypothetical protein
VIVSEFHHDDALSLMALTVSRIAIVMFLFLYDFKSISLKSSTSDLASDDKFWRSSLTSEFRFVLLGAARSGRPTYLACRRWPRLESVLLVHVWGYNGLPGASS